MTAHAVRSWVALSGIIRNLGIVIGGAIGIFLARQRVVASNKQADAQLRQAELSRRSHVTELFNRAVGQLKDDRLEIRLGSRPAAGQGRGHEPRSPSIFVRAGLRASDATLGCDAA